MGRAAWSVGETFGLHRRSDLPAAAKVELPRPRRRQPAPSRIQTESWPADCRLSHGPCIRAFEPGCDRPRPAVKGLGAIGTSPAPGLQMRGAHCQPSPRGGTPKRSSSAMLRLSPELVPAIQRLVQRELRVGNAADRHFLEGHGNAMDWLRPASRGQARADNMGAAQARSACLPATKPHRVQAALCRTRSPRGSFRGPVLLFRAPSSPSQPPGWRGPAG